ERFIFASRWVQAPLYAGLVVAMVVYAVVFCAELVHVCASIRNFDEHLEETVMMGVLTLVDITMVANLVVMVVIGGYATFVSRLDLQNHADRPDWLEKINAGTMKIKLTGSLVGISAIHLLKSFIEIGTHKADGEIAALDEHTIRWQVIIHVVFLSSGLLLAFTERVMHDSHKH
ncbi:MAG TPA: TIGR00645 family protein, partial [Planctomycetota bacterium]|nr:TIGR00645 family protein [Planctomycetota bacterium]